MKEDSQKILAWWRPERRNYLLIFSSNTITTHLQVSQPTSSRRKRFVFTSHFFADGSIDFNLEIPDSPNIKYSSISSIRSIVLSSLQSMIQISRRRWSDQEVIISEPDVWCNAVTILMLLRPLSALLSHFWLVGTSRVETRSKRNIHICWILPKLHYLYP